MTRTHFFSALFLLVAIFHHDTRAAEPSRHPALDYDAEELRNLIVTQVERNPALATFINDPGYAAKIPFAYDLYYPQEKSGVFISQPAYPYATLGDWKIEFTPDGQRASDAALLSCLLPHTVSWTRKTYSKENNRTKIAYTMLALRVEPTRAAPPAAALKSIGWYIVSYDRFSDNWTNAVNIKLVDASPEYLGREALEIAGYPSCQRFYGTVESNLP